MTGWLVLRCVEATACAWRWAHPARCMHSDDTGKSLAERNADINKRRLARAANGGGQLTVRRRA